MATAAPITGARSCATDILPPARSNMSRRTVLTGLAAATIAAPAIGATHLERSSWFENFDAETWIERWYRAGHKLMANDRGKPMLWINMDADEGHAARLQGELGWPQNRAALNLLLRDQYKPARPGVWCGYVRRPQ